jgi:hypothetical protein
MSLLNISSSANPDEKEKRISENSESRRALRFIFNILIFTLIIILLYAVAVGKNTFFSVVSVSIALFGAAVLSGGILGFLFGIPRTLQNDQAASIAPAPTQSTTGNPITAADSTSHYVERKPSYASNTNLEQISDWLTKILVGVGLTQLQDIKIGIASIIKFATPALGSPTYAGPFAGSLLLLGVISGFLFGYLWTRLFLIDAFRDADNFNVLRAKVDELKRQGEFDVDALNLIDSQLSMRKDAAHVSQEKIDSAILRASNSVRVQIYSRARDLRSRTWRDPSSKKLMERTIPIFRALIEADTDRMYHANHGQLAYALKDKVDPDYAEAEREFTTAIELRGNSNEDYWGFYELYRAVCLIKQDPNFVSKTSSDTSLKDRIISDLKRASRDEEAWALANEDHIILEWCKINEIDLSTLKSG